MAPIGVIGVCAQDGHGDLACAQASVQTGVPFFAGTLSADPMEEVAAALGDTPGFFQLYTPPDREMAASIVRRAEAAGFKGIAITLDTWVTGWRPRDLSGAHYPQVPSDCLTNYTSDPVFRRGLESGEDPVERVVRTLPIFGGPFRWDDLEWLRSQTKLPLMLEGHLPPRRCARRARDYGADAIYCSNHGGRQANGGLPTLECLPDVLEAADGLPVLFDSGVTSGADINQGPRAGRRRSRDRPSVRLRPRDRRRRGRRPRAALDPRRGGSHHGGGRLSDPRRPDPGRTTTRRRAMRSLTQARPKGGFPISARPGRRELHLISPRGVSRPLAASVLLGAESKSRRR